ncbi:MAG TPA: MgtC/SapB family protein [Burkholderiaceae bacterium]|jgi:putative Mg2+ transporter-C (MgtC) family protein
MSPISTPSLLAYWSDAQISTNLVIILNLLGSLALGLLVGYERSYRGRAAGMRTYGLVSMASTALTVMVGYSSFWYGGHAGLPANPDPTRVIQGIVTGIGFLGAGIILHDGFATRGLTSAASIWISSAIGVMIGIGFYLAAIVLALLAVFCMTLLTRIEGWLPSRQSVAVTLQFNESFMLDEAGMCKFALERGYEIAKGSIAVKCTGNKSEWHFVASALGRHDEAKLTDLAAELRKFEGIESFQLSHARN